MKKISYCIPNMDRDEDIKTTLPKNISVVSKSKLSNIIIIDFNNEESKLFQWIKSKYYSLINKKIFLHQKPRLSYWHFSKAKNVFKKYIKTDYYSSLDGDNFLSQGCIEESEYLINKSQRPIIIHNFSGVWGDGTCGRIYLPTNIYKKIGYQENIFPRQFDEIGIILKSLFFTNSIFYAYKKNIFTESYYVNEFIKNNQIKVEIRQLKHISNQQPINSKSFDYGNINVMYKIFGNINRAITLYPLSNHIYKKKLNQEMLFYIQQIQEHNLQKKIFHYVFDKELDFKENSTIVCKNPYVCVNNKCVIPKVGNFNMPASESLWKLLLSNTL